MDIDVGRSPRSFATLGGGSEDLGGVLPIPAGGSRELHRARDWTHGKEDQVGGDGLAQVHQHDLGRTCQMGGARDTEDSRGTHLAEAFGPQFPHPPEGSKFRLGRQDPWSLEEVQDSQPSVHIGQGDVVAEDPYRGDVDRFDRQLKELGEELASVASQVRDVPATVDNRVEQALVRVVPMVAQEILTQVRAPCESEEKLLAAVASLADKVQGMMVGLESVRAEVLSLRGLLMDREFSRPSAVGVESLGRAIPADASSGRVHQQEIEEHVFFRHPSTLSQTVSWAEGYEAYLGGRKSSHSSETQDSPVPVAANSALLGQGRASQVAEVFRGDFARRQNNGSGVEDKDTCRKVTHRDSSGVPKRKSGVQSGRPKPNEGKPDMKCWRCHGIGHFRRVCPNRKRSRVSSQTQPSVGRHAGSLRRKPLADIQCFKCREMGHYANRCPLGRVRRGKASREPTEVKGPSGVKGPREDCGDGDSFSGFHVRDSRQQRVLWRAEPQVNRAEHLESNGPGRAALMGTAPAPRDAINPGDDEDIEHDVWCLCLEPRGRSLVMRCGHCQEWFHGDCAGIDEENVIGLDVYRCLRCNVFGGD